MMAIARTIIDLVARCAHLRSSGPRGRPRRQACASHEAQTPEPPEHDPQHPHASPSRTHKRERAIGPHVLYLIE